MSYFVDCLRNAGRMVTLINDAFSRSATLRFRLFMSFFFFFFKKKKLYSPGRGVSLGKYFVYVYDCSEVLIEPG